MLQLTNTLQVRLASRPRSWVRLTVYGTVPPPTLSSLLPPRRPITAGGTGTLTATLSAPQPTATIIALQSSAPGVASVPATVSVPATACAVDVPIAAHAPGTAAITARLGSSSLQSTVTVSPSGPTVTNLTPGALQVTQGASGVLTITLSAAQPTETVVPLATSDPSVVGLPPTGGISIPASQVSQAFAVFGVSPGMATVSGSLNDSSVQSQVAVVMPLPTMVSILPPALPLTEGSSGTLTVTLSASQPTDTDVHLATSDPAVIALPADRVVVPAGSLSAGFAVAGLARGMATVTASLNGSSVTAAITVAPPPPRLQSMVCPPTVTEGATIVCALALQATQPADTVVPLTSSDPGVLRVPETVTVPSGSLSAAIPITGFALGRGTVSAGPLNGTTAAAGIEVVPPLPALVGLVPPEVSLFVGATATLTLTLNAVQLTDTVVPLTAVPGGVPGLPAAVTIPAGALSAPIPVSGVSPGTATVTAGPLNDTAVRSSVTVNQLLPAVTGLAPAVLSLAKGLAATLEVAIAPMQPEATVVPIANSDPLVAEIPPTVTVPAGAATAAIPLLARGVGSAAITAGPLHGSARQAAMEVTPAALAALTLAPPAPSIAAGERQAFTAIGSYTDGSSRDLTGEVAWSSDPGVAGVDTVGMVTAMAPDAAAIAARHSEGLTAESALSVTLSSPSLLGFTPAALAIAPGASARLSLELDAVAEADTNIVLTSSDPGVASGPASMTIPAGQRSGSTTVLGLAPGWAAIRATWQGQSIQVGVTVTANPPVVQGIAPVVLALAQGSVGAMTLRLSAVQSTDVEVAIGVQDAWAIDLPVGLLTVPAGADAVTFSVTGVYPSVTTVTATLNGSVATAGVWVRETLPAVRALTCPPAVAEGATAECAVSLNAAQAADVELPVGVTDAGVVEAPAVVRVPAGSSQATFAVRGRAGGTAEAVAGPLTETQQRASVAVEAPPPVLPGLEPQAIALAPGATAILTVKLRAVQSEATVIPMGVTPDGIVQVPMTVAVPAGSLSADFPATGRGPGTAKLRLGPLHGSAIQRDVMGTEAPPAVEAVLPAEASFTEWWVGLLTLRLRAAQPFPTAVPLASSDPSTVAVPPMVVVPAGALKAAFPVLTFSPGTATVSAGPLNGERGEADVRVAAAPVPAILVLPPPPSPWGRAGSLRRWRSTKLGSFRTIRCGVPGRAAHRILPRSSARARRRDSLPGSSLSRPARRPSA